MKHALVRTELQLNPPTREWVPVAEELLPVDTDVALSGKRVRLEEIELPETAQ